VRSGAWRVAMFALAAFLSLSAPAWSQDQAPAGQGDGAGVRARLAQPEVLRGRFEQRKQLQGFRNPLVSRGDFLLVRDRGVAWDTTEPFASSTLLTRERLLTRLPDGSQRIVLDAAASPGTAAVNSLLMALIAGDLDALAPQFRIEEALLADGAWALTLHARDAGLKRVFARIVLRGDRHVREADIEESGGDRTALRFLELSDQPATPTAPEAARFD
jgi:hypothetical protein